MAAGDDRTITLVPTVVRSYRSTTSSFVRRTHPEETLRPIVFGSFVPWMRYKVSLLPCQRYKARAPSGLSGPPRIPNPLCRSVICPLPCRLQHPHPPHSAMLTRLVAPRKENDFVDRQLWCQEPLCHRARPSADTSDQSLPLAARSPLRSRQAKRSSRGQALSPQSHGGSGQSEWSFPRVLCRIRRADALVVNERCRSLLRAPFHLQTAGWARRKARCKSRMTFERTPRIALRKRRRPLLRRMRLASSAWRRRGRIWQTTKLG